MIAEAVTLLPADVPAAAAAAIVVASFFSALLTATFGLGGGVALLGVMGLLLPAPAIVPVHGLAQFGANASRLLFLRASVVWPLALWFSVGALAGVGFGGALAAAAPPAALEALIGVFMLIAVWGRGAPSLAASPATLVGAGLVTSALTMVVGATGPAVAAVMGAARLDRTATVATHAAAMVVQHGAKSATFLALGFAFADWTGLVVAILAAGFAGSFAGARILKRTPEAKFRLAFKGLVTVIALALLWRSLA